MILYLIRHTAAVAAGTPGYEEDSRRPLTEKGKKKMRAIAQGLRALGADFDLILSSPYLRSRETAAILATICKPKQGVAYSGNLAPAGTPDRLITEIEEKVEADSIALVGHEPHLSALLGVLVSGDAGLRVNLKKGGVCKVATDDLNVGGRAQLEWLLTPAILEEIGEK